MSNKTRSVAVYEKTAKRIKAEAEASDSDTQADIVEKYLSAKPQLAKKGFEIVELSKKNVERLRDVNENANDSLTVLFNDTDEVQNKIDGLQGEVNTLTLELKNNKIIPKLNEGETLVTVYTKDIEKLNEVVSQQETTIPKIINELLETVNPSSCILILNGEEAKQDLSKALTKYMELKNIEIGKIDESVFIHELIKTYTK